MSTIYNVSLFEIKRLIRNPVYWLGWALTIGWAVIWDSPLRSLELWSARHCAYRFGHGVVTLSMFLLAIMFAMSFHTDKVTKTPSVLFTQPIRNHEYALGKFFGIYLSTFVPILVGLVCYLFIPLALDSPMYDPKFFIEAFLLYIVPSLLFHSSICYLCAVLLKEYLFAIVVPLIVFLQSEVMLPWQFHIRIPHEFLTPLTYGTVEGGSLEAVYNQLLMNRGIILGCSLILILVAIFSYSHKKYL